MQKYIHYLILYTCIYSAWSSPDMRSVRSFVQGSMPVVTGLVIGHHVGSLLGAQRSGTLAGVGVGMILDHYCFKGYKDRYAIARKMGNVMPVVFAAAHCYGQEAHLGDQINVPKLAITDQSNVVDETLDPNQQVSPYDMFRTYVFCARGIKGSLAGFHPEQTKESMKALVAHVASVAEQKDGLIRINIQSSEARIFVPCLLEREFAQEVMETWKQVEDERTNKQVIMKHF